VPTPTISGIFHGATDIYAKSGWQNDPRLADLIAAATAEGKVTYYSHSTSEVERGCEAFMEMFPQIECNGVGMGVQGISSGFIQEREAGVKTADVISGSMTLLATVQRRGYIEDIDWTADFGLEEGRCVINGNYCIRTQSMYVHWYNTDLVPDASVLPTDFEGFLDPRWKDELVASNFLYYQGMGYWCAVVGIETCTAFAEKIENDQNMLITSGQNDIIINGEKSLCFLCFGFPVMQRDHEGLPVDGYVTDNNGVVQFPLGVTDIAANPNAARLLVLWTMSTDGSYTHYTNNPLGCECGTGWPGYGHWADELENFGGVVPIIQSAGLTAVSDATLTPPTYDFATLAQGGVDFRNERLGQN